MELSDKILAQYMRVPCFIPSPQNKPRNVSIYELGIFKSSLLKKIHTIGVSAPRVYLVPARRGLYVFLGLGITNSCELAAMWGLGIEPGSSERVIHVVNYTELSLSASNKLNNLNKNFGRAQFLLCIVF